MSSFPFCAKSEIYFATGSFIRTLPSSINCMTAVVVAITFVNDARSKIVSRVMGKRFGSSERYPYALRYMTLPSCPTTSTAPGMFPSAIAWLRIESTPLSFTGLPAGAADDWVVARSPAASESSAQTALSHKEEQKRRRARDCKIKERHHPREALEEN